MVVNYCALHSMNHKQTTELLCVYIFIIMALIFFFEYSDLQRDVYSDNNKCYDTTLKIMNYVLIHSQIDFHNYYDL